MDELDFSQPAKPRPAAAPAAPKPVYNAAVALDFFRAGGKAEAVPAGTRFFEENQKAGFFGRAKMYLLLEGDVGLSVRGAPVGAVKVGEIFGEMAAISDAPRTATAVAKTACRVIALDDKAFRKALQAKPEFALMLMGMMIERLRAMLARHGAGTALFREGAAGALAYVVLEGRVAVTIQGKLVQRVGPGGIFGEMALVDQATRAASATTETDCALLGINRTIFLNLVKANPDFGAALLGAVAERVGYVSSRVK